jgi:hypothetical protein
LKKTAVEGISVVGSLEVVALEVGFETVVGFEEDALKVACVVFGEMFLTIGVVGGFEVERTRGLVDKVVFEGVVENFGDDTCLEVDGD